MINYDNFARKRKTTKTVRDAVRMENKGETMRSIMKNTILLHILCSP